MKEEFFAWNLDINDSLTSSLTSQIIIVALVVAGICFICNLAHNYLTSGFGKLVGGEGGDSFPNYTEIARCVVLIICISSYMPIAKTIVGTIETINRATSTERFENIESFYKLQRENEIPSPNELVIDPANQQNPGVFKRVTDAIEGAYDAATEGIAKIQEDISELVTLLAPQNLTLILLHGIAYLLMSIVKIIVQGVVVILTKVLVIVGPLAFAFSILPCFRKQLEQWFSTLLTTGMTLTTINILDAIVDAMTGHMFADMVDPASVLSISAAAEMKLEIVAFDFVIIVIYCSSFWLTSKYVGKGDAGRIISKLVSTATTLAAIAMTGGTAAGAGAAAAKSQAIQGAANAASKAIEE